MSRLSEIPVRFEEPASSADDDVLLGSIPAVLSEIQALLEHLAADGQTGAIDLRGLPMAPGEYERLREALGQGEVSAMVEALGPTRVWECAIPGVWWIQHRNSEDEVMAEIIEVTQIPSILAADPADIQDGLTRLQTLIDQQSGPAGRAAQEGDDVG